MSFLLLGITGLLLMFHYQPGANSGFDSIVNLSSVIPYGRIIRGIHFWTAQLMVISVNLHMLRVVWTRSYLPPKQLNWLIGVTLLILTLLLDFTGYLLKGSQESGAAATIAVQILQMLPFGGTSLAQILFGEPSPASGSTLVVYVWHCFIYPLTAFWLQLWHFWRIRRDGGIRPSKVFPSLRVGDKILVTQKGEDLPFLRLRHTGTNWVLFSRIDGKSFSIPMVQGSECRQNPNEQNADACHKCHQGNSP